VRSTNKAQAVQQLYRLYQHSGIFDVSIKIALNFAILELSGESGELPPKVRAVLDKMEVDTNRMMQMHKQQETLDIQGGEKR